MAAPRAARAARVDGVPRRRVPRRVIAAANGPLVPAALVWAAAAAAAPLARRAPPLATVVLVAIWSAAMVAATQAAGARPLRGAALGALLGALLLAAPALGALGTSRRHGAPRAPASSVAWAATARVQ